eukprot:360853-Chlamydomonas_euryale.AAC.9
MEIIMNCTIQQAPTSPTASSSLPVAGTNIPNRFFISTSGRHQHPQPLLHLYQRQAPTSPTASSSLPEAGTLPGQQRSQSATASKHRSGAGCAGLNVHACAGGPFALPGPATVADGSSAALHPRRVARRPRDRQSEARVARPVARPSPEARPVVRPAARPSLCHARPAGIPFVGPLPVITPTL